MFLILFIFEFDFDAAVVGGDDYWFVAFVDLFAGWGFVSFAVGEIVGNVYINILVGIHHAAYYYAGVKFKHPP